MIFEVYPFLTLLIAALAMRLAPPGRPRQIVLALFNLMMLIFCLLYTSDAADE